MLDPTNPPKPSRRLHFGLGALLLLVAGFAAIFGCYRFGYDRGISAGRERWFREIVKPAVYNVGDINRAHSGSVGFDIRVYIMKEIKPESWGNVGGQCQLTSVGQDQLIISQTADGHESIKEFLQSVRDGRRVLKLGDGK